MAGDPTQFMESNAILAAQDKDDMTLDRILSQMTEAELAALMRAATRLSRKCGIWLEAGGVEL